jgi:hypothetical protein
MTLLQQLGAGLVGLGGVVALLNWLSLYQTWRSGRLCSAIPLIGGLFLAGGLLLLPATRPFAWLAVILDYGTIVFFLGLPGFVGEVWSTSRFNLRAEYVGRRGNKTVWLRLFRGGVFTLEQQFARARGECGLMRAGTIGTWRREEDRLVLSLNGGDSAIFEPPAGRSEEAIVQGSGFRNYGDGELSLAGVELRLKFRRGAPPGAPADRPRDAGPFR